MHSKIALLAALASIAAASPAPQMLDFGAIAAAPTPSLTGPPDSATVQTAVYSPTSVVVNTVATASVTGAATSTAALDKRSPKGPKGKGEDSTSSTSTASSLAGYTSAPPPPKSTTTSTTTTQQSSTTTTTSPSACPTVPEAGTYCGFINPEDPCAPQPDGYGPKATPDTPAGFEAYQPFAQMALSAPAPSGYDATFRNLNASVSANTYLGLYTLKSYNTSECGAHCDSTTLCTSFNIYIERDPSLNPTNTSCANPSSLTNYKCTLWGSGVDAAAANNFGDYRGVPDVNGITFHAVIAGSDGFSKLNYTTPAPCPSYDPPKSCGSKSIDKPALCLGQKFFPGPYDPSVCATYGQEQTQFNQQNAGASTAYYYTPCNMFNAYMVKRDGYALGTYCSLYNTKIDKKEAKYSGGMDSQGHSYTIESSWTYDLSKQRTGDAKSDSQNSD